MRIAALTKRAAALAALAGVTLGAGAPAVAQTASSSQSAAVAAMGGTWELSNPKSTRNCRVHLGSENGLHGYQLGSPPACRTAFPVLAQAAGWTLNGSTVAIVDASGRALVTLQRDAGGAGYLEPGADGLSLKPLGAAKAPAAAEPMRTAAGPAASPAPRAGAGVPPPPPPPASVAPNVTPQSLAGLYGVARERNKPICSIDLTLKPARKGGLFGAQLSGGCIDPGLKIFDPVAWHTGNGRLYLVAKKGHEQGFSVMPDGAWQKDPPSGSQLFLKKQ